MIVGGRCKSQLREDPVDVPLDSLGGEHELLADSTVGATLGHQCENFALARREVFERAVRTAAPEQLRDDLWVKRRSASAHTSHRVEELVDFDDPILQEVAEAFGPLAEQIE